ncbi:pectinesterase 63 [Dorcoceras hygrometricum]|uniref:Pectinesterase 63 n=1 Tax=Dorcoceras hygrometricum TaxID=472368 RepID=A0A2Z7B1T5_9LAMI|nr:pectinesterase 63 [Dorcoceras hygrometricum]
MSDASSFRYSVVALEEVSVGSRRAIARFKEKATRVGQPFGVDCCCISVNQQLRLCVVPEKSNAIIGVVTTGFEFLPSRCDGLTGCEDHGPMISPVDTPCGYRG